MAELADALDLGSSEAIRVGSTPTTRTTSEKLGGVPGLRPVYRPEFFFLFRVDPLRWVRRGFLFRWCTGAFIGSETNAVFRCRKGGAAERFSFGAYAEAVERSLCRRRPSFSSFQNSNHFVGLLFCYSFGGVPGAFHRQRNQRSVSMPKRRRSAAI